MHREMQARREWLVHLGRRGLEEHPDSLEQQDLLDPSEPKDREDQR